MAVKTEGEKTAMLRSKPVPSAPMSVSVSAGKQKDGLPVTRKKA